MTFANDLKKFKDKTLKDYEQVKRKASFDLFSSIVIATPVDKGVLRNNWFVGLGTPDGEIKTDIAAESPQDVINRGKGKIDLATLKKDIYFTNNLPYSVTVEFGLYPNPPVKGEGKTAGGYSLQAPAGMVRINTARWDSIVKNAIASVRRGK